MANENQSNNRIRIRATSTPNGITVSSSDTKRALEVTNNDARYYSDLAKKYKDEAKLLRDDAKYYAEQNSDVTMLYVNTLEARLQGQIDGKQSTGDYALNSSIPTNVSSLNNDSQYVNSTQLGAAIDSVRLPSQTGHDGEFLYTNGENPSWKGVNELCAFDVIEKDHILSYSESKGYVQIGEYAYKEAVAGSHYGYPDFYSKCLEEYNNPDNTLEIIKNNYTVVGSPTITSDGIASGFGASNLVTINQKLLGTSWQLKMLVKPVRNTVDIKAQCFASMKKSSGGGVDFHVYTGSDATSLMCGIPNQGSISAYNALTPNTWQTIEIKYSNKMLSMYVEGEQVGDSLSIDLDNWVPENNLQFGYNNWGAGIYVYYGFIDLKGVEVSVDGVPVFSGNQTGIDTIKPDDYTVVGSPTITDDGVARGFSNSNYLEKNISISSTNYKIETIAKPSGQSGDIVWGTYTTVTQCPRLQLQSNSVLLVLNDSIVAITIPITWDTSSYYKFISEFDGSKYTLSVYKNEILVGSNTYISNVNYISNATKLSIGRFINNTYFQGTIDLNSFKIYVNDELVYQPCLKIPYTLSNAGRKVVDTVYSDRVTDMYEQFGYTPYYMSDTYHEVTTYRAVDCIRTNPNGHKYYDISNKPEIDDIYDDLGEAWYYGVDTVNERILLPRTSDINNGKYLYMVTGNTPDWTGVTDLVDQGTTILNQVNTGIVNAIETRLDLGITNIASIGKNNIMEMLMPDYSSGITISSGYEAVFYGFVVVYGAASDQQQAKCYVNGELVGYNWNGAQGGQDGYSYRFYVSPGDVITWDSTNTPAVVKIYPLKGV